MKSIIQIIICCGLLFLSTNVFAAWIEARGRVVSISTYFHTETILITLDVDGRAVTECSNTKAFAISSTMNAEARARMYSMLLAAQASGRDVRVAYNDIGYCESWDSNQTAYRRIMRISSM